VELFVEDEFGPQRPAFFKCDDDGLVEVPIFICGSEGLKKGAGGEDQVDISASHGLLK